ncbi:MAG TPA: LPS export ABC transporter periplasmic protein LptC [Candidatus Baltobacteraceae bacterium]
MKRLLFVCVLAATACNPQPGRSPGSATPTPGPTITGAPPLLITSHGSPRRPLVFYGHKDGRVAYKMIVRDRAIANTAQGAGDGTFYDVTVTFYDKSGRSLQASAPRAVAVEAKQTLTLYDGVTTTTSNGDTLTCRRMVYDRASGTLHGDGGVVLRTANGYEGTGNSFDSDITLENLRMQ